MGGLKIKRCEIEEQLYLIPLNHTHLSGAPSDCMIWGRAPTIAADGRHVSRSPFTAFVMTGSMRYIIVNSLIIIIMHNVQKTY